MIRNCIKNKEIVIFADEAVFSAGQVRPKIWYTTGDPLYIEKKRLAFRAVAVVAGIDMEGNVHGLTVTDGSI